MITLKERIISLAQAAESVFPQRPSKVAVWRWARHGHRGLKLETLRISGRIFTSAEACERFIAAQNGGELAGSTESQSRKAQKNSARAKCEAAGL